MKHGLKLVVGLIVLGVALAALPGQVDAQSECSWEVVDIGEVECEFTGSAGDTFEIKCIGCVGPLDIYNSSGRLVASVDWLEPVTLSASGKHTAVGEYSFFGEYQEVCRDNPSYSAGCNDFGECGSVGGEPTICELEYTPGEGMVSIYVTPVASVDTGGADMETDGVARSSSNNNSAGAVPESSWAEDGAEDTDDAFGFQSGAALLLCCAPISCLGVMGIGGGIFFAVRKKKSTADE